MRKMNRFLFRVIISLVRTKNDGGLTFLAGRVGVCRRLSPIKPSGAICSPMAHRSDACPLMKLREKELKKTDSRWCIISTPPARMLLPILSLGEQRNRCCVPQRSGNWFAGSPCRREGVLALMPPPAAAFPSRAGEKKPKESGLSRTHSRHSNHHG
jgi:hypothetical protein